jgi:hypothetical protein
MPFPFGPGTIAALIEAISDGYSHSDMTTLFLRAGVDDRDPGVAGNNKATRVQAVLRALRDEGDVEDGEAALELSAEVLTHAYEWGGNASWLEPLELALAGDELAFDRDSGRLVPSVEGVDMPHERAMLEREITRRGWNTAAAHYRQAIDGISSGNWEAANGQMRCLLEVFVPDVAASILGTPARSDPRAALGDLDSAGVLVEGEFDFARGLWRMCNTRGAHAGLSSEEEARFRLLAVTAYVRFLLSRMG